MAEQRPKYISYLLRMWREDEGEEVVWRASLQSHGDTARRGFASLDALFEFLHRQTNANEELEARTLDSEAERNSR